MPLLPRLISSDPTATNRVFLVANELIVIGMVINDLGERVLLFNSRKDSNDIVDFDRDIAGLKNNG